MKDLKAAYKTIETDHFAPKMEISFISGDSRQTFHYEKVTWNIGFVATNAHPHWRRNRRSSRVGPLGRGLGHR